MVKINLISISEPAGAPLPFPYYRCPRVNMLQSGSIAVLYPLGYRPLRVPGAFEVWLRRQRRGAKHAWKRQMLAVLRPLRAGQAWGRKVGWTVWLVLGAIYRAPIKIWDAGVLQTKLTLRMAQDVKDAFFFSLGEVRAYAVARGTEFWMTRWVIRKSFILGMLGVVSVAGSSLWALASLPYLPGHAPHPATASTLLGPGALSAVRSGVPSELAWFFIEFPYLSADTQIKAKNHHTFLVFDPLRRREYVVTLGQNFRRAEVYYGDDRFSSQAQVFTPGSKRTVVFKGSRIVSDTTQADANLWMWRSPLWNPLHLKIYALADFWIDSPYKRYSCAGFVHQFLRDAGVQVPLLNAWDYAKQPWTRVSLEEIEPGDIITIKAGSPRHRRLWHHAVTHVAVYVGNGKVIHAATVSPKANRAWVRITDLSQFSQRIDKILRAPDLL
jgi:hypothetical protein